MTRKLSKQQASCFTDAILAAGARYNRYQAAQSEWKSYSARRAGLDRITKSCADLVSTLDELDPLTRDDLAGRLDGGMDQSISSIRLLRKEAMELTKKVQKNGRWRDLAEERWIFELQRGDFYRLLTLSLPSSFPRHGKLSVKQVDRVLKRRIKRT